MEHPRGTYPPGVYGEAAPGAFIPALSIGGVSVYGCSGRVGTVVRSGIRAVANRRRGPGRLHVPLDSREAGVLLSLSDRGSRLAREGPGQVPRQESLDCGTVLAVSEADGVRAGSHGRAWHHPENTRFRVCDPETSAKCSGMTRGRQGAECASHADSTAAAITSRSRRYLAANVLIPWCDSSWWRVQSGMMVV